VALLNAIIHLHTLKQQNFLKLEFQTSLFGKPGVTDTGNKKSASWKAGFEGVF